MRKNLSVSAVIGVILMVSITVAIAYTMLRFGYYDSDIVKNTVFSKTGTIIYCDRQDTFINKYLVIVFNDDSDLAINEYNNSYLISLEYWCNVNINKNVTFDCTKNIYSDNIICTGVKLNDK